MWFAGAFLDITRDWWYSAFTLQEDTGILTGLLLSKTYLRGNTEGLIMELPHTGFLPKSLLINTEQDKRIYQKAGTVISFNPPLGSFLLPAGKEFEARQHNRLIDASFSGLCSTGFDFRMTAA